MMKKLTIILFVLMLIFTFASCGGTTPEATTAPGDADETTAAATEETTAAAEETTEIADETTEAAEEATAEVKNATLTVEQTDDISGIGTGKVFNASTDEYAFYAVFRTDVKITDVNVLGLTFVDASDDGTITFDKEELYSQAELNAEDVLCVHLTADGAIPAYGISYVDTDGTQKSFSVNMSGEDGSLYLSEIK